MFFLTKNKLFLVKLNNKINIKLRFKFSLFLSNLQASLVDVIHTK